MVQVVTVATHECDGLDRFLQTCPNAIVLGLEKRKEFNMNFPGGGFKVNLLKNFLISYKNENDLILFSDSFDAIIANANIRLLPGTVVFSAEMCCWPDKSLENKYPASPTPYRFLNSGGFIGSVKQLREILDFDTVKDTEDDQLFYTRAFLSGKFNIALDVNCRIFQTFNASSNFLRIHQNKLVNVVTNTQPHVLHGNGSNKIFFNRICDRVMPHRDQHTIFELPSILVAFDTPECVVPLKYEEKMLTLTFSHTTATDILLPNTYPEDNRRRTLQLAKKLGFEAVMFVGENHKLTNKKTLTDLCVSEKKIVAPMLVRPETLFANFWTDISDTGYYKRGFDYMDIVNRELSGTWNVPYIGETFLVRKELFRQIEIAYEQKNAIDRDMRVCKYLRDNGIFMYVNNICTYGTIA